MYKVRFDAIRVIPVQKDTKILQFENLHIYSKENLDPIVFESPVFPFHFIPRYAHQLTDAAARYEMLKEIINDREIKIQWIVHRDIYWYKQFNNFNVEKFSKELSTKNFYLDGEKESWEPNYHKSFDDFFKVYSDDQTTIININACNVIFKEAYIFINESEGYEINDILRSVPFSLVNIFDCQHSAQGFSCKICDVNFKCLQQVSKTILENLLEEGNYPEKLFISRKAANKRYINDFNERFESSTNKDMMLSELEERVIKFNDEIEEIFQNKNYTIVDFDGLTLKEQVNYVHHAKYIAGFTGTNLINIIFCNPNAKIIEIQTTSFKMKYEDYSKLFGLKHAYLNLYGFSLEEVREILT